MIRLIEEKKSFLVQLCRQYDVKRLELFGSAATGNFNPQKSDVDFLVEFKSLSDGTHADHYFGFQDALQETLGYPVDLVMVRAIKNTFFLQAIADQRELLYAA